MRDDSRQNLAYSVYEQLRSELFDFRLLPGDRFSEIEVAERTGTSRTPVRQALYRLQSEGFLEVRPRSGWEVKPLNFDQLDALYELRILLEQAAVRRLNDSHAGTVECRTGTFGGPLAGLAEKAERQCRRGGRLG